MLASKDTTAINLWARICALAIVATPLLSACAQPPSPVGEWREIDGNTAEIRLLESGSVIFEGMESLWLPKDCPLVFDDEAAGANWVAAEGGGFEIQTAKGNLEFHYDVWYGKPLEDKALVFPCSGELMWVFARE